MNYHKTIEDLLKNGEVFKSLLTGLEKEEYLWKSKPEKWCLLEIICHLYDEEREDFRARIKHVLANPKLPLPQIDPAGWVSARKYTEQNYAQKLDDFLTERKRSVDWLRSLTYPSWDNYYNHPKFGQMSAKMFLANWLAHDYLHIRQIIKLKFDHLKQSSGETLSYAGDW